MALNEWIKVYITPEKQENLNEIIPKCNVIVIDTETTGLNLTQDKPFFITFATKYQGKYMAFSYDITENTKEDVHKLVKSIYDATKTGYLIGHNLLYDLHMLMNETNLVPHDNLLDTMTMIRLAMDAVPEDRGGPSLSLKQFSYQYITPHARDYEKMINSEKSKLAQAYNKELYKTLGVPTYKFMEYNKELAYDIDDLPDEWKPKYIEWLDKLPKNIKLNMKKLNVERDDIPYNMIPRETLRTYAVYDAILTYEIYEKLMPIIKTRGNYETLEMEIKLMKPLLSMTRQGFELNVPYIKEAKTILKDYIFSRKEALNQLAGEKLSVNQSKRIKELIQEKFKHPEITSTNEETLALLQTKIEETEPDLYEFIRTILELRTLAKWNNTYFKPFYDQADNYTHIHTSLNPAGAVTGRFSSPFQQFPKGAVYKSDGTTLFEPRRMMKAPKGKYLVYMDYSQVELRIQALYTILIGSADKNLCRAYMPYDCHHYRTNIQYDYENEEHTSNWHRKQPSGESVWLLNEDNTPWIPTDLHAKTTSARYPKLDTNSAEFKKLRSKVGKRANFACNYGAKAARLHQMFPNDTMESAQALYNAYATSFPGVIEWQKYCYNLFKEQNFGTNLYGRRYYNTTGHNYANAAIQGTGADLLKNKIIDIYAFLAKNNYKTRMQMNIHDEISFIVPPEELHIIPQIKHIMETIEGTYVPIVADLEITDTTWADKKGFHLDEKNNIVYEE